MEAEIDILTEQDHQINIKLLENPVKKKKLKYLQNKERTSPKKYSQEKIII